MSLPVRLSCAFLALIGGTPWACAEPTDWPESTSTEARANGRYLLMDVNGRAVTNADFPGQFQLISFGYTYCPDICPTTLAEQAAIMQRLGARAERIQPIFITVDPERDTPDEAANLYGIFRSAPDRSLRFAGIDPRRCAKLRRSLQESPRSRRPGGSLPGGSQRGHVPARPGRQLYRQVWLRHQDRHHRRAP